jgi:exopolyphosphatase/guanosine-5'-triphosphate,3'-diphosphate pyrophosphatase
VPPELRGSDLAAVREQLDREPTVAFSVTARCLVGHPLVIRNAPRDVDGTPFPTTFWLTCPEAVRAIARLESAGALQDLRDRMQREPDLAAAVEATHIEARALREGDEAGAGAWGGVAGTKQGLKCLHAHYANLIGGGDDPIGRWAAERIEPIHGVQPDAVAAAIDQGTNSTRLAVVATVGGVDVELARDMIITRLGRGVDATGRFDPDTVERTIAVLGRFARRARVLGATSIVVGATSAVRDARDRKGFLTAVRVATGVDPEIIEGSREAVLSFRGGTRDLDPDDGPFLVVDIGGGSTELVAGREPGTAPDAATSLQLGSVRLHERLGADATPSEMDAAIAPVLEEAAAVLQAGARTLVGVGGTAATLQAFSLGLDRDDPDVIHGSELTRERVAAARDELAAMSAAERDALACMPPGRGDVIVAGASILLAVMDRVGAERVRVSETDILDALAREALVVR